MIAAAPPAREIQRRRYYQLVASLPMLPHFRRAATLPISQKRLEERLPLLHPDDLADLKRTEGLLSWSRQPVARTTTEIVALYDRAVTGTRNRELRNLVIFRMNVRTVMVALRLRRLGRSLPPGIWGVGPYVKMIESRWAQPDFGLIAAFPWIPEALALLKKGDAMELEGLLMDRLWTRLGRAADDHPFGFEQVFAFVYRWDILNRWLSYDAEKARQRFDDLILEVTRDHQDLFA